MKRAKKLMNRKGFTLIELIVVIVIIGILAAIVIPRLAGFQQTAAVRADIATARTLATAAATVYAENMEATVGTMVAADGVIENLLPDGTDFDWASQANGADFVIDVVATGADAGEVTVTVDSMELYPTPDPAYGAE